ncbi:MAG: MetQ/NlpA family ABC transporter substrate-binding protein [Clostridia bacterium]|nr:MetQ/NlpA family ABC transporter substrate-binding protein [Clostridia bacterium]
MKRIISLVLALVLCFSLAACAGGGAKGGITIGIPNDPTNEARALELLQSLGYITLKDLEGDDVQATVLDVVDNPYNITFKEVEAAQLPSVLQDMDYAIINSNYAISAGISPITTEGTDVSYPNVIVVKEGNEDLPKIKALVAAINSQPVVDFMKKTYAGAIVCDLENVTADGKAEDVDYAALKGETITIAASPTPHCDILKVAKDILAKFDITLDIKEYTDYVQPNNVVEAGEVDANYFQHIPYLDNFNEENGTHLVSVLPVHHEPMGIYSATKSTLDAIKGE